MLLNLCNVGVSIRISSSICQYAFVCVRVAVLVVLTLLLTIHVAIHSRLNGCSRRTGATKGFFHTQNI